MGGPCRYAHQWLRAIDKMTISVKNCYVEINVHDPFQAFIEANRDILPENGVTRRTNEICRKEYLGRSAQRRELLSGGRVNELEFLERPVGGTCGKGEIGFWVIVQHIYVRVEAFFISEPIVMMKELDVLTRTQTEGFIPVPGRPQSNDIPSVDYCHRPREFTDHLLNPIVGRIIRHYNLEVGFRLDPNGIQCATQTIGLLIGRNAYGNPRRKHYSLIHPNDLL
jgi:hypothetical protein